MKTVEDFKRHVKDEMRSGKLDGFVKDHHGKFCLILLKEEMRKKEIGESGRETKPFDPLSINP